MHVKMPVVPIVSSLSPSSLCPKQAFFWLCDTSSLAKLPFYLVSLLHNGLGDKPLDVDAVVNMEHDDDQFSPMESFNCNINGHCKHNLKIGQLKGSVEKGQ